MAPQGPVGPRALGFKPVVDQHTRVLILGSLPGNASLKAAQYYAHPRNGFWHLVGGLVGDDLARLDYPTRLERLLAHRIGLWDVIASAERAGSLDAAIRFPEAADLRGLVQSVPTLKAIAFNGALAARMGRRILSDLTGIAFIDLPSSSPAHAVSLTVKAEAWDRIRPFLSHLNI